MLKYRGQEYIKQISKDDEGEREDSEAIPVVTAGK
jgi:hypothetical protein